MGGWTADDVNHDNASDFCADVLQATARKGQKQLDAFLAVSGSVTLLDCVLRLYPSFPPHLSHTHTRTLYAVAHVSVLCS